MDHQWCFLWVYEGFGSCNIRPLARMTQLALILLQLPSRQLNCVPSTQDKWPQKWLCPWVSLLILQQPIRARLHWWLLKLSFKIIYKMIIIHLTFRVFANGSGDRGSISGLVIPKTQKIVLDTSKHYKVRIESKEEKSRERSRALPYTLVPIEK